MEPTDVINAAFGNVALLGATFGVFAAIRNTLSRGRSQVRELPLSLLLCVHVPCMGRLCGLLIGLPFNAGRNLLQVQGHWPTGVHPVLRQGIDSTAWVCECSQSTTPAPMPAMQGSQGAAVQCLLW